jgi:hypothetical protein
MNSLPQKNRFSFLKATIQKTNDMVALSELQLFGNHHNMNQG